MAVNYIIEINDIRVLSDSVSSCDYYVKDADILFLKNNKDSREALLKSLNVDKIIVSSLGVNEEEGGLYKKHSISVIKVGDKKWI